MKLQVSFDMMFSMLIAVSLAIMLIAVGAYALTHFSQYRSEIGAYAQKAWGLVNASIRPIGYYKIDD